MGEIRMHDVTFTKKQLKDFLKKYYTIKDNSTLVKLYLLAFSY